MLNWILIHWILRIWCIIIFVPQKWVKKNFLQSLEDGSKFIFVSKFKIQNRPLMELTLIASILSAKEIISPLIPWISSSTISFLLTMDAIFSSKSVICTDNGSKADSISPNGWNHVSTVHRKEIRWFRFRTLEIELSVGWIPGFLRFWISVNES